MPSTKSLPTGENMFLRGLVQKVLDGAATQTEAAQRLGVSQSYLNEFMGGTRGAGPKLLKGLARLHPRLAARLLGLADADEGTARPAPDPRTAEEAAIDAEFSGDFAEGTHEALVEAVQYAAQRGPRFFRRTWWRILRDDRRSFEAGALADPIDLGKRLLEHARAGGPEESDSGPPPSGDEDDTRPTLPAPAKKAPPRRGTRKDTPAAKKGR